ncbi:hypothetical protein D9M68_963920 [compost metagenome]
MFENARHRFLQSGHLQQPFVARRAEGKIDTCLACILAQWLQVVFQAQLKAGMRFGLEPPAQINCAFRGVIRQGLAELHGRMFTTAA